MINKKNEKGQAIITLLFIMVIAVVVITAVVIVAANNIASGSAMEQATVAYYAAEAGAQNAILRSLRDPAYNGEVLTIGDAIVTVQVSGNVITSVATYANSIRKIEVQTMYNSNNVLSIESWKEIE